MRAGERVRILYCPAHPEAAGSVGQVIAVHLDVGRFGADVVEVRYRARGRDQEMPFAPENIRRVP